MQTQPVPPAPPLRKWTEAERSQVKEMLAHGATALQVADAMNIGRNAALGRIYRDPDPEMKLQGYAGRPRLKIYQDPKPRQKTVTVVPLTDIVEQPEPEPEEPEPEDDTVIPIPLVDTGKLYCKWPVAEDPAAMGRHLCCGRRVRFGMVYCRRHYRLGSGRTH